MIAQQAGDAAREDSLVAAALALQRPAADAFSDELVRVASRLAFARGDLPAPIRSIAQAGIWAARA
jgi:hypothetical protein